MTLRILPEAILLKKEYQLQLLKMVELSYSEFLFRLISFMYQSWQEKIPFKQLVDYLSPYRQQILQLQPFNPQKDFIEQSITASTVQIQQVQSRKQFQAPPPNKEAPQLQSFVLQQQQQQPQQQQQQQQLQQEYYVAQQETQQIQQPQQQYITQSQYYHEPSNHVPQNTNLDYSHYEQQLLYQPPEIPPQYQSIQLSTRPAPSPPQYPSTLLHSMARQPYPLLNSQAGQSVFDPAKRNFISRVPSAFPQINPIRNPAAPQVIQAGLPPSPGEFNPHNITQAQNPQINQVNRQGRNIQYDPELSKDLQDRLTQTMLEAQALTRKKQ